MKFGIVTPLLNARATFTACAASVKSQENGSHTFQVQHIVRESESSHDKCEDIAQHFACTYTCKPDSGLYDAIQSGLDEACASGADILGWLNADEQYLPNALTIVQKAFDDDPALDLIFGNYLITDSEGKVLAARCEIPAHLFLLRNGVNYILSCTTFFRKRVWDQHRPFDLSYRLLADKKFYLSALSSGITSRHIPAYLGAYGSTGHNESLSPSAAQEQARLRAESGAYSLGITRKAVRSLRCAEKLLRGCYGRKFIRTTLFDHDGMPHESRGRVGTKWRWS